MSMLSPKIRERNVFYHKPLKILKINRIKVEAEAKALEFLALIHLQLNKNAIQ